MTEISRRNFIASTAALIGTGAAPTLAQTTSSTKSDVSRRGRRPTVVASANGLNAIEKTMEMLRNGADPLDAVIAAVSLVEEDPNDHSVGYGGLPNEEGVVELDASVMHGPTHQAGAVAALRNVKTPSKVAKLVMERTDHVLLVGEGALKFARAHGFEEVNLLTDEARQEWLRWKETHSRDDDWLPPPEADQQGSQASALRPYLFTYGTINCCAVTAAGDLAGVTTTSGLSYKIPGRVGDSPIIGAGLFVDNEVGAAGSTGRGEAVIQTCGAHVVVEMMRQGKTPEEACLEACKRIAQATRVKRLLTEDGKPNFGVTFYAVNKDGAHGGAGIWAGGQYAVYSEGERRLAPCAHLYERKTP